MRIIAEIAVVFAVMLGIKWLADSVEIIGAGSIAIWCGIIVVTLLMRRRNATWRGLGMTLPNGWREWAKSVGLALAIVVTVIAFMALVLEPITVHFGLETPDDSADRFAFFLGKPVVFLTYLVLGVWVGAALGEELLFRGFLLNRLGDLIGHSTIGWSLALVLHSIIFGFLHIYQGIPGVIGSGAAALIFGIFYFASKRKLFPVILGHSLINTISLTAYYLSDGAIT